MKALTKSNRQRVFNCKHYAMYSQLLHLLNVITGDKKIAVSLLLEFQIFYQNRKEARRSYCSNTYLISSNGQIGIILLRLLISHFRHKHSIRELADMFDVTQKTIYLHFQQARGGAHA